MTAVEVLQSIRNGTADARELALPVPKSTSTSDYREWPVAETLSSEGLETLDAHGLCGLSYFAHATERSAFYRQNFAEAEPRILLRRSALLSLARANELLLRRYDRSLFGYDGFRSLECQKAIRKFFVQESRAALEKHGSVADAEIQRRADELCSRPAERIILDDPRTWHAHVTGGAFDVLLRTASGEEIEWGAQVDRHGPEIATNYYERCSVPGSTEHEARSNRRILFWVLTAHGWVNYSREFWHFDILRSEAATQFAICNHRAWGFDFPLPRANANLGPARM